LFFAFVKLRVRLISSPTVVFKTVRYDRTGVFARGQTNRCSNVIDPIYIWFEFKQFRTHSCSYWFHYKWRYGELQRLFWVKRKSLSCLLNDLFRTSVFDVSDFTLERRCSFYCLQTTRRSRTVRETGLWTAARQGRCRQSRWRHAKFRPRTANPNRSRACHARWHCPRPIRIHAGLTRNVIFFASRGKKPRVAAVQTITSHALVLQLYLACTCKLIPSTLSSGNA